ncbi:MAG: hypothetical protein ABR582_00995 [Gemmatimonadaceae bacterium]
MTKKLFGLKLGAGFLTLVILSVSACNGTDMVSVSVTGNTSQTVAVPAATEFTVTLETVGPGEYISPPKISSSSVRFLDAAVVPPYTPAGPRQRFRFLATTPGKAIIVFQHSYNDRSVEDTISVR